MRLYRIANRQHIEDLRGLGASYASGGRWNGPGVPALYFGESAAVALLELANYFPSPRLVPSSYRLGVFEVSEGVQVERWSVEDLPPDWRNFPYPASTQRLGTAWLAHGEAHLLSVPSVAIPGGLDNIVLASPARLPTDGFRLARVLTELYGPSAFASPRTT